MAAETDLIKSLKGTLKAAGLDPEQAPAIIKGQVGGDGQRPLVLLLFDVDHIQETLLASPRPVTIYGASDGMREFDKAVKSAVRSFEATVVYAGGGNALLVAPLAQVEATVAALKEQLAKNVPGAEATADWLPLSPRELAGGPAPLAPGLLPKAAQLGLKDPDVGHAFGALVANLQHKLRLKKSAARAHAFLSEPPKTERCEECAWRPRSKGRLCSACAFLREQGGKTRSTATEGFQKARSFEELFGIGHRIAYVHIDGRGIGKQMRGCKSLLDYRQLSESLQKAFYSTPSAQLLSSYHDDQQHRFVLITSGGDDLLLVIPATGPTTDVFTFVRSLLEGIQRDGFTAGAGIVITKSLAADYCCQRAMRLCKDAKQKIEDGSVVNFEFLLAGSPDSTEQERSACMEPTQRPYTLADFGKLVDTAHAVSEGRLPRAQLQGLRDAFDRDPATAELTLLYQMSRNKELRQVLLSPVDQTTNLARVEIPPLWWRPAKDGKLPSSAIPDLIDIARTVQV